MDIINENHDGIRKKMTIDITTFDVFMSYKNAEKEFNNGRPFRIPKNWDSYFENRPERMKKVLEKASLYFMTKWERIDMDEYMRCGFSVFGKKFKIDSNRFFFNYAVIKKYIHRDKEKKSGFSFIKEKFDSSKKFMNEYMSKMTVNPEISLEIQYCQINNSNVSVPIIHYVKNRIDKYFLVYLIKNGYLSLTEEEKSIVPEVVRNYRKYSLLLDTVI